MTVRRTPWILYLLTLASAWPLGALVAAANPRDPEQCSGIGFGCTLSGRDISGFLLMIFGLPYAVGLAQVIFATIPEFPTVLCEGPPR